MPSRACSARSSSPSRTAAHTNITPTMSNGTATSTARTTIANVFIKDHNALNHRAVSLVSAAELEPHAWEPLALRRLRHALDVLFVSGRSLVAVRWSRWISRWISRTSAIRSATSSWTRWSSRPSRKLRIARDLEFRFACGVSFRSVVRKARSADETN